MSASKSRPLVAGLVLVALGAVLLIENLSGGLSVRRMVYLYVPALLLGWGLYRAIRHFLLLRSSDPAVRPPSLVGALFWLGVGLLLLLSQRTDLPGFWVLFATWWPMIVILAGLGVLTDALLTRRSPRLGGGEVVFLIFLAVGGALAHQLVSLEWPRLPWLEELRRLTRNPFTFHSEQVLSVDGAGILTIDHQQGDLHLVPSPDDRLHLRVESRVDAATEEEARRRHDGVQVDHRVEADRLVVRAARPGSETGHQLNLRLEVPAGMSLDVRSVDGGVEVQGLASPATLATNRGDLAVTSHNGPVTASCLYGAVTLRDSTGAVVVNGVGAEIRVDRHQGELTLATTNEAIRVQGVKGNAHLQVEFGRVRVRDHLGGLTIQAPNARRVELEAVDGPVTLSGTEGRFELTGIKGAVQLDLTRVRAVLRRCQASVEGQIREGRLEARELGGDVRLELDRCEAGIRGVTGDLELSNQIRGLTLRDVRGRVTVRNENGPVTFHGLPVGRVQVVVNRGDVTFRLPKAPVDRKIWIHLDNGFLETDFDELIPLQPIEAGSGRANFTGGRQVADLDCQVNYGKIRFRKAGAEED